MRWVSRKAILDLAKSEHARAAWLLSWWNDSSCMHKVAPVSSVRLSAWSPAAFLPKSWGSTGLDKIVGSLGLAGPLQCQQSEAQCPAVVWYQGYWYCLESWAVASMMRQSTVVGDTELEWTIDQLSVEGPIQTYLELRIVHTFIYLKVSGLKHTIKCLHFNLSCQ